MEMLYKAEEMNIEREEQQEIQYNNLFEQKSLLNLKSVIFSENDYIKLAKQFRALNGYKNAEELADECQNVADQAPIMRRFYMKRVPAFLFAVLSIIMLIVGFIICPLSSINTLFSVMLLNIALIILPFVILFCLGSHRQIIKGVILGAGISWNVYIITLFLGHSCNNAEIINGTALSVSNLTTYALALIFPLNDDGILSGCTRKNFFRKNKKFIISLSVVLSFVTVISFIFSSHISAMQEMESAFAQMLTDKSIGSNEVFAIPQSIEYELIFRYFILLIISLYVYMKILNLKYISKSKITAAVLFSLIISIPLLFTMLLFELIFLGSICIFVAVTTKVKINLLVPAVLISVAICLGVDFLFQTIITIVLIFIETINITVKIKHIDAELLTVEYLADISFVQNVPIIVQIATPLVFTAVFIYFLFKTKRLKKGFAFLHNPEARRIGIILSIIIMINKSFFTALYDYIHQLGNFSLITFFFAVTNICTFGMYFWWNHHTTMLYHERLNERTIQEYQAEFYEKDKQIKTLSESNEFLSEAVHRDNKLIPAMYNSVSTFLNHSDNSEAVKIKGRSILSELDEIMLERKNMILEVQKEHNPLPSTEMSRIDNILNYMCRRAAKNEIQFDFDMAGSVKDIAESIISKQNLETLLADLIENAIIATSYSTYKKILVTMGIIDDCYEITVKDSGKPFEIETLINLGIKKSTTYVEGNGIGYLTIFKILGESSVSLIISEQVPENNTFSKSIKIRFDEKSEFIIYSFRADEIERFAERERVIPIIRPITE